MPRTMRTITTNRRDSRKTTAAYSAYSTATTGTSAMEPELIDKLVQHRRDRHEREQEMKRKQRTARWERAAQEPMEADLEAAQVLEPLAAPERLQPVAAPVLRAVAVDEVRENAAMVRQKQKQAMKRKERQVMLALALALVFMVAGVVGTLLQKAALSTLNVDNVKLRKNAEAIAKRNDELIAQIGMMEDYNDLRLTAQEELGMTTPTTEQVRYITLPPIPEESTGKDISIPMPGEGQSEEKDADEDTAQRGSAVLY